MLTPTSRTPRTRMPSDGGVLWESTGGWGPRLLFIAGPRKFWVLQGMVSYAVLVYVVALLLLAGMGRFALIPFLGIPGILLLVVLDQITKEWGYLAFLDDGTEDLRHIEDEALRERIRQTWRRCRALEEQGWQPASKRVRAAFARMVEVQSNIRSVPADEVWADLALIDVWLDQTDEHRSA